METRRWTNPSQPQTLQIAVWLLYFNAIWGILFSGLVGVSLLLAVGLGAGAFGIANDKRWGYYLAIGITLLELVGLLLLAHGSLTRLVTDVNLMVMLLFTGARAALLLHPMSRDYQRVWFR